MDGDDGMDDDDYLVTDNHYRKVGTTTVWPPTDISRVTLLIRYGYFIGYKLTTWPPSPILRVNIPIDSSSLTDYISEKIFRRSRLVRALGRLKNF